MTVLWGNIQAGREHNFKTYVEQSQDGIDLGAFDFGSIMMYGSFFFSTSSGTDKPVMLNKLGQAFEVQRDHLSAGDRAAIAAMYPSAIVVRPSLPAFSLR